MKTLKELTWEHHKEAERQHFVKTLMSGKINPEIYAVYLFNQHQCYNIVESLAMSEGILDDMPELRRAKFIKADFDELWTYKWQPAMMTSTKKYLDHCNENLMDNPDKIAAHIYVRHMGDLSGGQMIKSKVPGQGTYYNFNIRYVEGRRQLYKNIKELEEALKVKVNSYQKYSDQSTLTENINSVVYEARMCFGFATELFKDMQKFIKDNEKRFGDGLLSAK
jgi:heme oxygenase